MFIMRESIWWLLATGAVGLYLGYLKGMARWGLLLGLLFGPIGWGLLMFLPARPVRRHPGNLFGAGGPSGRDGRSGTAGPFGQGSDSSAFASGSACPRCGKPVGRRDKACGHCGNVLMPIRYRVTGPAGT